MAAYFYGPNVPTLMPYFGIGQFIYGFAVLSSRGPKLALGIDHNEAPRGDLAKYGKQLVEKGKITQARLDQLTRQEAAHANTVENLPFFWFAITVAQFSGLPNAFINRLCLVYTLIRVAYSYEYIYITSSKLSQLRTATWWAGNFLGFYTLWSAGQKINAVM